MNLEEILDKDSVELFKETLNLKYLKPGKYEIFPGFILDNIQPMHSILEEQKLMKLLETISKKESLEVIIT